MHFSRRFGLKEYQKRYAFLFGDLCRKEIQTKENLRKSYIIVDDWDMMGSSQTTLLTGNPQQFAMKPHPRHVKAMFGLPFAGGECTLKVRREKHSLCYF